MENEMTDLLPKKCPYCGSELKFDGIHLMCPNQKCDGRLRTLFYDKIKLLEIKGLGESMAYDFFDFGCRTAFDVFSPNFNSQALIKAGVWDKNIEKVFMQIQSIKHIPLEKVIQMSDFDGMGKTTSEQCAKEYAGLNFDYSGLEKMVVEGFQDGGIKRKYIDLVINKLADVGIEVDMPKDIVEGGVGVEFTGSPKPFFSTKEEFLKAITNAGFFHTSLKDAKILVTDSYSSTSSKMTTAKKKGLEVITYEDFCKKYIDR